MKRLEGATRGGGSGDDVGRMARVLLIKPVDDVLILEVDSGIV